MTIKKGEEMNIHEKLSAIQIELKAPKGQYNSFGKYRYRSAEDILKNGGNLEHCELITKQNISVR